MKREDGGSRVMDTFNDEKYIDDAWKGGPQDAHRDPRRTAGVLLGGGIEFLAGIFMNSKDASEDKSMQECVISNVSKDCTFFAIFVDESDSVMLDYRLSKFGHTATHYDAAELLTELEEVQDFEKEMAKKAKAEMRDKKRRPTGRN